MFAQEDDSVYILWRYDIFFLNFLPFILAHRHKTYSSDGIDCQIVEDLWWKLILRHCLELNPNVMEDPLHYNY